MCPSHGPLPSSKSLSSYGVALPTPWYWWSLPSSPVAANSICTWQFSPAIRPAARLRPEPILPRGCGGDRPTLGQLRRCQTLETLSFKLLSVSRLRKVSNVHQLKVVCRSYRQVDKRGHWWMETLSLCKYPPSIKYVICWLIDWLIYWLIIMQWYPVTVL